jgi:hypothetical protein
MFCVRRLMRSNYKGLGRRVFYTGGNAWTVELLSLGGVVVSVLATGPKVRGFKPAEDDGY